MRREPVRIVCSFALRVDFRRLGTFEDRSSEATDAIGNDGVRLVSQRSEPVRNRRVGQFECRQLDRWGNGSESQLASVSEPNGYLVFRFCLRGTMAEPRFRTI